jgi:tRNA pseudouridine55 synthase
VTARLGESTDTGDADGNVIETASVPSLDADEWTRILQSFVGDTRQVPPMYSALKKNGKRLYELARTGQIVEREARPVRIRSIELIESSGSRLMFRVHCSKGTYVRSLVEDIAKAAGTVAHTSALHRETVGNFRAADMLDLPGAEKAAHAGGNELRNYLLPADSALSDWPEAQIEHQEAERFCAGQRVRVNSPAGAEPNLVRVYGDERRFLGIGERSEDGWLAPKRVFR